MRVPGALRLSTPSGRPGRHVELLQEGAQPGLAAHRGDQGEIRRHAAEGTPGILGLEQAEHGRAGGASGRPAGEVQVEIGGDPVEALVFLAMTGQAIAAEADGPSPGITVGTDGQTAAQQKQAQQQPATHDRDSTGARGRPSRLYQGMPSRPMK